ncbi:putative ABC transport system ATP-binding protein [Curtobacterium sp. UNCCL20]|uniref:ABC transporter ATP-binding protein n=1 Tax=Curtobacterium sp. UNCCL20 TaxID=1502773 RepID=UPI0008899E9B|nr:ATP-binding cassette domain-containing protein [Curtobacterium sp. UNCCL20]SDR08594.1 putative ABC transport system ATP-binding protein [Curtobacterium sp. UNCCL20]
MNSTPLVSVTGLGYDLGPRRLWHQVSFDVPAGQALALRGASGSGKSTLLRCLAGLDRVTRGRVVMLGTSLGEVSERERRRLRRSDVGCIVQDHAVVPEWTVEANLRVLRLPGVDRAELDARLDHALLAVGLGGRRRARAGLLSGGEQQRVAVARVLVQRPKVVLADEPTASLDRGSAARVRVGLDALRAAGSAVVVATHDPEIVDWADDALVVGES